MMKISLAEVGTIIWMLIAAKCLLQCTRILVHARLVPDVPALAWQSGRARPHRCDAKLSKTGRIDAPRIASQRPKPIGPIHFSGPAFRSKTT
jgi:hypothetical protein